MVKGYRGTITQAIANVLQIPVAPDDLTFHSGTAGGYSVMRHEMRASQIVAHDLSTHNLRMNTYGMSCTDLARVSELFTLLLRRAARLSR